MKKRSKAATLFRMLTLVKPLFWFMVLAVTTGTLAFIAVQFIPILGSTAILNALDIDTGISTKLIWWLLPVLALLRAVLRFTEQRTNHYIAFTLLAIVRDRVFKALRKLCPAKLDGHDKGALISLITSDVELLEVFYAHTISPICIAITVETVMCLYIGSFNVWLGVLALVCFLLVGVAVPVIISHLSGETGGKIRSQSADLAAHILESIRGLDETVQYNIGNKRMAEMKEKSIALGETQSTLNKLTGTNLAVANTFILISDAAMLILAISLYNLQIVDITGVIIPVVAFMSSFGPVTALASLGTTLQNTIASGERILNIIDEQPETEEITDKEPLETFENTECCNVNFGYDETVLDNFSMTIHKNKIIGIMGKSGSGKSTLLKLLMRFYSVKSGEIRISNRNIENINTADLRSLESYMTQETQLFKDTIANNIRIAKLDATQEEIEQACKKASVHDFIMTLPQGYETPVGELGETLSGGERQRIGLARAFLHNAPLILLDEPTSNLDSLNEAVILKALREETKGKTVVLVSHRESTMRIADQQFSVENGRLS